MKEQMRLYHYLKDKSIYLGLLLLGIITHALYYGVPNSAVFDEVHFGKFLSAYFTHQYYFDIHPPLGKLILAGWGWLWGYHPGFSFANIGEVYPDKLYMALRFLPSLAGALLPLVIYGVARCLRIRRPAAVFAGVLVALDNALLVQSRFILLDPFLLLFGFAALYCYLRWRDTGRAWLLPAAGVLAGASASIKWTGLTFLGLIVVLELFRLWAQRHSVTLRSVATAIGSFVIIPVIVYVTVFVVHFSLLARPGPGDAFMTPNFQSLSMADRIVQLNAEMYRANATLTATHPYSSLWYTWPMMARPIFYWVSGDARIYLLGNPVVWWLSTIAIITALVTVLSLGVIRAPPTLLIIAGAWLMNMLPFIGITRVMFLYHYLTALIWAILALAYFADQLKRPVKTMLAVSGLALVLFVFFAPLSYGLPLTDSEYNARVWFSSWR
ncbi:MAG TPA: phospholipid carrier-dependent glycosyltransferase [Candidatus Paceibacterota bacterium]|nr:phospholipid carrier-dependent glycosyltransferase [Candidatus Paceibacterota bacterium]